AGAIGNLAHRISRCHVQAEDGVDLRIVECPFLHHQSGAAFFSLWRAFFRRLKEKHHGPRQFSPNSGKDLGHAEEDGHVCVVSAGVHHADFLALYVVRAVDLKGTSTCSVTGRASISARNATMRPGFPPRSSPITPVWAIGVRTSMPSARRRSATSLE